MARSIVKPTTSTRSFNLPLLQSLLRLDRSILMVLSSTFKHAKTGAVGFGFKEIGGWCFQNQRYPILLRSFPRENRGQDRSDSPEHCH